MRFIAPPAPLLLIGGTADGLLPLELVNKFVELAGGPGARLAVITSGSRFPLIVGPQYAAAFAPRCAEVRVYHLLSRADANSAELVDGLERASGIFFSGGEQLLTTTRLGATLALDIIRARFAAGAAIGGTSAGASVVSGTMIAFGQEGETPRHAAVALAPGLGFLPGVIVDQHFGQHNRLGRLTTAVLYNPAELGIGIDESTAVLIRPAATLEVLGAAAVTIIDGSKLEATDAADVEPLDAPLSSHGLQIYRLTAGDRFDLEKRTITRNT